MLIPAIIAILAYRVKKWSKQRILDQNLLSRHGSKQSKIEPRLDTVDLETPKSSVRPILDESNLKSAFKIKVMPLMTQQADS